jgi:hypothetical protein
MIDIGVYNPITLTDRKENIRQDVVLKLQNFNYVFTGVTDVKMKSYATDAVLASGVPYSWTYKGETINSLRLNAAPVPGTRYYIEVDGYFSDFIIMSTQCRYRLFSKNSCTNQYHDWDTNGLPLFIDLYDPQWAKSEFETEESIIITEKGQKRTMSSMVEIHRLQFIGPIGFEKLLQGIALNDDTKIESRSIKNTSIEVQEQNGGALGLFTLSFQYADLFADASGCCDIINIDDIQNPDIPSGGEACADFQTAIVNTSGTLSVTLTSPPTGTPQYKWYRNGVFITSAATLEALTPGNYRVDVRVATCSSTSSYFLDNPCNLFDLVLTSVNNEINGTVSNIPDGETVAYSVVFNGLEVGTALPYTAAESGIYYIYATAGDCEKVKGMFINLVDDDCDFTISIDDNGTELEAVTDATTPTYLWEFEDGNGKTTIGAAAIVAVNAKGIYWLTISQGGCSKTEYLYKEPLAQTGVFVRSGGTGTLFSIIGINLLNITNFAAEIKITINGVVFSYVAGVPTMANTYGVNGTGQIIVPFSLTNPTIIVELI